MTDVAEFHRVPLSREPRCVLLESRSTLYRRIFRHFLLGLPQDCGGDVHEEDWAMESTTKCRIETEEEGVVEVGECIHGSRLGECFRLYLI
jgi:hypothetical protein